MVIMASFSYTCNGGHVVVLTVMRNTANSNDWDTSK